MTSTPAYMAPERCSHRVVIELEPLEVLDLFGPVDPKGTEPVLACCTCGATSPRGWAFALLEKRIRERWRVSARNWTQP